MEQIKNQQNFIVIFQKWKLTFAVLMKYSVPYLPFSHKKNRKLDRMYEIFIVVVVTVVIVFKYKTTGGMGLWSLR